MKNISLIDLTQQGSGEVMPFIKPHRHERYHIRNLLAYVVAIVMDESNIKRVKG